MLLFFILLPKLTQAIVNIKSIFINSDIFFFIFVWSHEYFSFASSNMHIIILVRYRFFTEFAWSCSRLALLQMQIKLFVGNIKLAVGAVFWLHIAFLNMLLFFFFLERFRTKFTCSCTMKLLLVFLQKIFIVHLGTYLAFYDVSSAVPEMGCRFRHGNIFQTVSALLSLLHL